VGVERLGYSVKEDGMCEDLSLLLRAMRVERECLLFAWAQGCFNAYHERYVQDGLTVKRLFRQYANVSLPSYHTSST